MLNQISHFAGLLGMALLSYDITEFRIEACVGRETQQRAKRRHGVTAAASR